MEFRHTNRQNCCSADVTLWVYLAYIYIVFFERLTDQEIQSISLLPQELYSCELASYPYSRLLSILTPLICSLVLAGHQQYLQTAIIASVGLLSLPLGKHFFREFYFRQQQEQRLSISAKSYASLSSSMHKHLQLSLRVNAISQMPLILFSIMPFLGVDRALFANYLAFMMGLSGLTGLLAFQKSRVSTQHTVKKANNFLRALSNDIFLLSEKQFNRHCGNEQGYKLKLENFEEGVIIEGLIPNAFLPSQNHFKPLSISIPKGGFYVLQAPSGHGKSLIILSLLHLINHQGNVYLVAEGQVTNVHRLPQKACSEVFVFFRKEDLAASARLLDLFSKLLQSHLNDLYLACEAQFGFLLNELAWNAEDNLLEQEIKVSKQGGRTVFPQAMIPMLIQIRKERNSVLTSWLKDVFDHDMDADRVFCTLSAGEQRRIINLLTLKAAHINGKVKLAILDEPLANLDSQSIERQLQILSQFQRDKQIPILIITHHHVQEIEHSLKKGSLTLNPFTFPSHNLVT